MPRRFTTAIFCRATFPHSNSVRRIRCSPATKSGKRQDRPRLHAETTPPGDPTKHRTPPDDPTPASKRFLSGNRRKRPAANKKRERRLLTASSAKRPTGTARSAPSQDTSAGRKNRGEEPFPDVLSPENRGRTVPEFAKTVFGEAERTQMPLFEPPPELPSPKNSGPKRQAARTFPAKSPARRPLRTRRAERRPGPRNRHRPPRPRTSVASASRKARKRPEPHTKNPALFRERDLSKARRNPLIRS